MLETLANELLVELFGYFRVSHLLRAFRSLNSRFEQLLVVHLRHSHHLHLRSISKADCNHLCQHHLHSLSTQINSLTLSNDDESPQQTELLLSYGFTLRRFTHLRSLSMYHSSAAYTTNAILKQCLDLSHLTHLHLIECEFDDIDLIWRLPKLSHLSVDDTTCNASFYIMSTSTCLQVLVLYHFSEYSLINLLEHTPNLRYLDIDAWDVHESIVLYSNECFVSVVTLKLVFGVHGIFDDPIILEAMETIFRLVPNIRSLVVEISSALINGNDWERLITTRLPKLENFQFKMQRAPFNTVQRRDKVEELFRSFQGHFWTVVHQWFIGCHWHLQTNSPCYLLFYTLPYTFPNLFISSGRQWYKSTCPYEDKLRPYDSVRAVEYASPSLEDELGYGQSKITKSTFGTKLQKLFPFRSGRKKSSSRSDDLVCCDECSTQVVCLTSYFPKSPITRHVPHVRRLTITLPHDNCFRTMIPSLDHLHSLDVLLTSQCNDASQLQRLLDRAPHLYSLTLLRNKMSMEKILIGHLRSASVRMLNLRQSKSFGTYSYYNSAQCVQLTRSQLGKQCEVLIIRVKHRQSILYLVNKMANLRALSICCEDDPFKNCRARSKVAFGDDYTVWQKAWAKRIEFIRWLQSSLPSTVMIDTEVSHGRIIRLWIR